MKDLNHYRPSQEVTQAIKRQIVECGIDPAIIPNDWVEASVAAMTKWIITNQNGSQYILKAMGFQSSKGMLDKEYILLPENGPREVPVKAEDVCYYRGITVRGYPIRLEQLEVRLKTDDHCEDCGIISHCTKVVLDPQRDGLLRLCNFCITSHESPKVYDQGENDLCFNCPKFKCSHNKTTPYTRRHIG